MNISFLFGAGISIPSGMASTQDITDKIFSGKDIIRHTDSSYYIIPDYPNTRPNFYSNYIDQNIEFLKIISNVTSLYYEQYTNRKRNYEDLYYLIEELYQEVSGDTDNPMTKSFLNNLEPLIKHFFTPNVNRLHHLNDPLNFLSEVKNYMKCIIKSMLCSNKNAINGIDFFKSLNNDEKIKNVNIFSLNHDLLLEKYFDKNNIKICDGFSEAINNVRYWDPKLYLQNIFKINLFKVHGSINWYRLREEGSDWHDEEVCIVTDGNIHRSKNKKGKYQFDCDTYPLILVGTFNKLVEYSSGVFMDLICLFNKNLNECNNLIISGYSFGDKGINSRITEWAYKSHDKRIIIINPDINNLKNNARGSIRNKWDSWISQDKLQVLEKGIEEMSWDEIKDKLKWD